MSPERWQQIEQLYHATRERPATERAAYLTEACPDDESLRREVELLLAANEQASGFLTVPALQLEAQDLAAEKASAPLGSLIGQQLSHYKILSRIGAGGMGEVYLARDANLERHVALKLLPVKFTEDAERLQRFVREAKAASALNHPNIITIYEIGEAVTTVGKTHFIATEFIEGKTLRRRMAGEGLTLREALEIAIQVAAALDAAHKAGIVHRDIKPENLMVRPDGLVKVLDFGLAKLMLMQPSGANEVDTNAETLPQEMKTQPGMILGTLRYMSPEQARGRALDARTDIFSLGVVLYELLTGQPLFAGESSADVIAAIIHKEPAPLAECVPDAPPELERIVRKALAKDSRERYQDARDLQIDLQALKQESELSARLARAGQSRSSASGKLATQSAPQIVVPRSLFWHARWILPVVMLLSGVLWWFVARRSGLVEIPPLAALQNVQIVNWPSAPGEGSVRGTFSPDGKWIAFTSTRGGSKNVWVKQATAAGDAQPSTQNEFINLNPIWSPNGEEIAFTSGRGGRFGIWRKPTFGDTSTLIKALPLNYQLCSWSKSGATIYYEAGGNLFALEVNSGQTKQLTQFESGKTYADWFSISPDERQIAYRNSNAQGQSNISVVPVSGGTPKQIANSFTEATNTVWHRDNYRVFFSARVNGTYQVFVADLAAHQPAQLTFGDRDSFVTDVSTDGTKVLLGSSVEESNIFGVDVAKAEESAVASDIDFEFWPSVSPDSQMIAYQTLRNFSQGHNSNSSILLKTITSADKPRLLVKEGYLAKWTPDGKRLAFMRNFGGSLSLWVINSLGGEERRLAEGQLSNVEASTLPHNRDQSNNYDWSPDGSNLVYAQATNGQSNLWMATADGSSNLQVTNHNDPNLKIHNPFWSSDGERLAYLSKTNRADAEGNFSYGVWLTAVKTKEPKAVFQAKRPVRLLGWSATEQELILALFKHSIGIGQAEVELIRVDAKTGAQRPITVLPNAYHSNIHLSADRRMIAFTGHLDGKDNVWLVPVSGGVARKLTRNSDPNIYFSSLAWAPNNRTIYFGKQTRHGLFTMLTNFE